MLSWTEFYMLGPSELNRRNEAQTNQHHDDVHLIIAADDFKLWRIYNTVVKNESAHETRFGNKVQCRY